VITSVVDDNVGNNVDDNVGNNVLRKDGLIVVEFFISVLLSEVFRLSYFICKDGSADGSSVVVDGSNVVVDGSSVVVDGSSVVVNGSSVVVDGCRDDGCLDVDDNSLLIITECNIVGINDGENIDIDDGHVLGSE
jgi:hypothetical protein